LQKYKAMCTVYEINPANNNNFFSFSPFNEDANELLLPYTMRTLAKIKTIANARVFKPTSSIREDDDGGGDGGGDGTVSVGGARQVV